jgi:hypothetical protein
VTHGLQDAQGRVEAWVQMMEVGPWISQKCASEICGCGVSHGCSGNNSAGAYAMEPQTGYGGGARLLGQARGHVP